VHADLSVLVVVHSVKVNGCTGKEGVKGRNLILFPFTVPVPEFQWPGRCRAGDELYDESLGFSIQRKQK